MKTYSAQKRMRRTDRADRSIGLLNLADIPTRGHGEAVSNRRFTIEEIISIEPRVKALLDEAKHDPRTLKERLYPEYKWRLMKLVGWESDNRILCCDKAYDTALKALCEALDL